MSDEADALAETARNRGLKLMRSRVRTPTKRAFGKYALVDAKGEVLLGGEGKHPNATAKEVEDFLRSRNAVDWARSLHLQSVTKRKAPPKLRSRPAPPRPEVREARPADAPALARLLELVGHATTPADIRRRLKLTGQPTLVAVEGKTVIGLCGLASAIHIHRDTPVGRITVLVVAEDWRGKGVGRMLVEEALARLARAGCGMVEVTSNDRLVPAHAFYRHLGFDQTSKRFAKALSPR